MFFLFAGNPAMTPDPSESHGASERYLRPGRGLWDLAKLAAIAIDHPDRQGSYQA